MLLRSYGFMIGFSWEKAYHSATHILLPGEVLDFVPRN